MPLPDEVTAAFAVLAEYVGDDKEKAREVALAIRNTENVKPIGAVIYNAGAASKKGETSKTVGTLEAKVTELTEANEELTTQLEAASKKPNEQQAEWDRQKDKLTKRAEKAEGELNVEREGRTGDRVEHVAGRVAGHLKDQVDEDYRKEVLAGRIAKRVRTSENGKIELLGDDDSPLEGEGEEVEKALAAAMLKAVPDKFRLRNMQPGGGAAGGGASQPTREQLIEEQARSGKFSLI